jgi:hypothetical protein
MDTTSLAFLVSMEHGKGYKKEDIAMEHGIFLC